jgi:hypothetical protein
MLGNLPSHWPMQTDLLQWCQNMGPAVATLLVMGGIIYLMFGIHIYRYLVMLNAALVGAAIGAKLGERGGSDVAGACVGAFIAASLTWPMLKYAVAIMGGIFGTLLGASLWRAAGLEPSLTWAGAFTGLVGFGMLSFVLFRGSVIMYTSLQGAVMLIFGILGLAYKYQDLAPKVTENMTLKPFLLPLLIFIPAMLGLIYQQTMSAAPEGAKKK